MVYLNSNFLKENAEAIIADEPIVVGTSSVFNLVHSFFYAEEVEIYTAVSKGGTQLSLGTDFAITDKNIDYSDKSDFEMYETITLLKTDWNSTTLYIHYIAAADTIDADTVNDIQDRLDVNESDIDDAETAIETLEGEMNSAEGRLDALENITISTAEPTSGDGVDGDLWFVREV